MSESQHNINPVPLSHRIAKLREYIGPLVDQSFAGKTIALPEKILFELHHVLEELCQQNEQQPQDLFETSSYTYIITDLKGVICKANQVAHNFLNLSSTDLTEISLERFFPETERPRFVEYLNRVQLGAEGKSIDIHLFPNNRPLLFVTLTGYLMESDKKDNPYIRWLLRDITQHKPESTAPLENKDFLETIFDHTPSFIAFLDPKFNFIRVNRAYAEADNKAPSFFPGKNHFDLYPSRESQNIFQSVVETGKPYVVYGKPYRHPDHIELDITYWDWSLIPIKDATGRVTGLVHTLFDVTRRVEAEKALEHIHSVLEQHVAERTAELAQTNVMLENQITERRQAEETLEAGRTRLRELLSVSPAVTYAARVVDSSLFPIHTFISENVQQRIDYTPQEVLGDAEFWSDHVHPDDSE